MKQQYRALTILSNLFGLLGWLCMLAAAIVFFTLFSEIQFVALLIALGVAIFGLFLFAFSELIKLFIKIEENTRRHDFSTL